MAFGVLAGVVFPLSELMEATGQKKEENLLGRGGYGTVYRGVLRHATFAVKFLNEVGKFLWTGSFTAYYCCCEISQ